MMYVKSLIPLHKIGTFKSLFRFPTESSVLTQTIFDKLSKIFDGRNPVNNYQFLNSEYKDDWDWYRTDVLKSLETWKTDGWEYFKTEINSVLIVDLPEEQKSSLPEPYFYWLTIDKVIDFEVNTRSGNMEYIIFKQPDNKIAVFDDQYYRLFKEENGMLKELISENPHDLGYCPARFFWNESISLSKPNIKRSPITKVLADLDWFLFFHTSKKHLDLYGAYPIYSGYVSSCDYRTDSGDECSDGFIKNAGVYSIDNTGGIVPCPRCSKSRLAGAGTFIEVVAPQHKDDPDLSTPIKINTIDRQSLDYNVEEEERLGNKIIISVSGNDGKALDEEAVNELQVNANFENQSTILNSIKKGFEEAWSFTDSTMCKLRYGSSFISCDVNLGTEFYIFSSQTLRENYKLAKESGASESELDSIKRQIIETENRHDKLQMQRMMTLLDLEPYSNISKSEALEMLDKQLISKEDFILKSNFSNFVRRFERENTNILEFGIQLEYYKKIEIINETLKSYAKELTDSETNPGPNPGNLPVPGKREEGLPR